ncbi:MAG: hypothetical protein WAO15_17325 [Mycobacterium sp.]
MASLVIGAALQVAAIEVTFLERDRVRHRLVEPGAVARRDHDGAGKRDFLS